MMVIQVVLQQIYKKIKDEIVQIIHTHMQTQTYAHERMYARTHERKHAHIHTCH